MKKSSKIIMSILLALGATGGVFAYGMHSDRIMNAEEKAEFIAERVSKKLDLNEVQRQNLQVLSKDIQTLMGEMRSSQKANINEIQQMLTEPALDQDRILKLIQERTQTINDKAPAAVASLVLFCGLFECRTKGWSYNRLLLNACTVDTSINIFSVIN